MGAARAKDLLGPNHNRPLDKDLRGYLETNDDILTTTCRRWPGACASRRAASSTSIPARARR